MTSALVSQIDLAKVERGEKKDSYACSTNTYYAKPDTTYKWHQAYTVTAFKFSPVCCGRWVWVWFGFKPPLPFCNYLKSEEKLRFLWLFLSFLLFFSCFYTSHPLLQISGIIHEKAQIWAWRQEAANVGSWFTINQGQGSLSFTCFFSYVNCLMLQNGCRNSRHHIDGTQKEKREAYCPFQLNLTQ